MAKGIEEKEATSGQSIDTHLLVSDALFDSFTLR
jgi:hypothetical protein